MPRGRARARKGTTYRVSASTSILFTPAQRSKVLSEIQAGVQARDLIGIAVEHERSLTTELADAALARLGPPRVVDFGVHVRVEAVLARIRDLPRVHRLLVRERHANDRLHAL